MKCMDAIDYLRMQLRLEGKDVVGENSLRQVEAVPGEEMPLMLIAKLADRNIVVYFNEVLETELRSELIRQISGITFPHVDPLSNLLKQRHVQFEIKHYQTYLFPKVYAAFKDEAVKCYSNGDSKVQVFGFDDIAEEVYAIERDGRIISACVSIRENKCCGEAWARTDKSYRRQGLARRVVGAWANGLISVGKNPFYSHEIQNSASAGLAKRLELQPIFEEIVISHVNV